MVAATAFGHGAAASIRIELSSASTWSTTSSGRLVRENARVHDGRLDTDALLPAKPHRKADPARMIRAALAPDPIMVNAKLT
jgi:hypothetical protein